MEKESNGLNEYMPEGYRLSPIQKRIWSLGEERVFQRVGALVRWTNPPSLERLRQGFQALVADYEIFRTVFPQVNDTAMSVQVILGSMDLDWSVVDLQHETAASQEEAITRLLAARSATPFHLEQGPLLACIFFQLSATQAALFVDASAFCADSFTLRQVIESVSQAASDRPEVEVLQHADLAEWLYEELHAPDTQAGRDFWSRQLLPVEQGIASVAGMFSDSGRDALPRQTEQRCLSAELSQRVCDLALAQNSSVELVLLACWLIVLHHSTQQAVISSGVALQGRFFADLQKAMGPLTHYVPCAVNFGEIGSFQELLAEVTGNREEVQGQQHYFSWDQFKHAEKGSPSAFSALFAFEVAGELESAENLAYSYQPFPGLTERYDIQLSCIQVGKHYELLLHQRVESRAGMWLAYLLQRMETLLQDVVARPTVAVGSLNVLGLAEKQHLLRSRQQTVTAYRAPVSLHSLVEQQVARTPHAPALFFKGAQLSYQELQACSNHLSWQLQAQGIGTASVVAVCMERSLEMVIALLAILKAGGVYLPLDPANPDGRIRLMVESAQPSLIITQQKQAERFSDGSIPHIFLQDYAQDIDLTGDAGPEPVEVSQEQLAYIIYTSGSTGVPKGVAVSHEAICNRLLWGQRTYPLSQSDRVLQSAAVGFDFSLWELFAPLCSGASCVLLDPEDHQNARPLVSLIEEQQITVMHGVPSMLRFFLQEEGLERCASLRLVFSGGEALRRQDHEQFFRRLKASLYNQYGPTETAIDVTYWPCSPLPALEGDFVPIGRPIDQVSCSVLNEFFAPVPIGAPGELYVGGVALARGYYRAPASTAAAFLPDPFSQEPGARLYRTGDMVRYREDGSLEFLGRRDAQIKLRGFRIELGEIEAALSRQPLVQDAVALFHQQASGDGRVNAYIVGEPAAYTDPAFIQQLKDALKTRLPDYMLPTSCFLIERMPLNAAGKTDRQALLALKVEQPIRETVYVAPRSAVEEMLVDVWRDILELETIGVQDNFFDLGGHSLLAMQFFSRLRDIFHVELPLRPLFERPTIEGCALSLIQMEEKPGQMEKIARIFLQIHRMSANDVKEALKKREEKRALSDV